MPGFPYLVIVFCYTRILVTFRRAHRRVETHAQAPRLSALGRQPTLSFSSPRDRVMDQAGTVVYNTQVRFLDREMSLNPVSSVKRLRRTRKSTTAQTLDQ